MTIREQTQQFEIETLSAHAAKSADSRGRTSAEPECDIRTPFQRDRDRILHSKAFRRLKGKTQVFLSPEGDHYRTRLTHTLEVAQISRTVARALRLNEDLTEAIALGHDLGHTPFGHAGEEVLGRLAPGGFHHAVQSVRVVERLEQGGRGLNLTFEVRDGIRKHSKGIGSLAETREKNPTATLEAEVVRICDTVAYANHDLDDAIRAALIRAGEIPAAVTQALGVTFSGRINVLVHDIVRSSSGLGAVMMSPEVEAALEVLREFLLGRVYKSPVLMESFGRAKQVLEFLWNFYLMKPGEIPADDASDAPIAVRVCDFLAGMTDRYALNQFQKHLMPHPWADED
jgi:dGTPase